MLSQSQTFDDPRCLKVVVVPVGDNSHYDAQFAAISAVRSLQLYDLPRANFNRPPNAQFFKSLNITNNSGNLLLDYLRYDRVPGGQGDLDDFQSSRRILMIVGVVNYPEIANSVDKVEEDMEYFARRHPHTVLKRILVFNYSFEPVEGALPLAPSPLASDPQSLVVLPPDGACEGGSMVEVHLQEVLTDAIMRVLLTLEAQMVLCNEAKAKNISPPNMQFATIYDDIDDASAAAGTKDAKAKKQQQLLAIKKKPGGRIRKWMGDLCMQACSPLDALEHYTNAIADCRALGDSMWLASALEGYVASIVLLQKLGLNPDEHIGKELKLITSNVLLMENPSGEPAMLSDSAKVLHLLEERANEALTIYSRNVVHCVLEVELTLRLARLHESDSSLEREQRVMHYVLRAAAVPGLNPQQQTECTLEGALICRRLGMKRKYAFLLYVAALMTAESDNMVAAHSLVSRACAEYGVRRQRSARSAYQQVSMQGTPSSSESKDARDPDNGDVRVVRPSTSWVSIRRVMFAHAAYISREVGDSISAARNASALLRLMAELASRHKKKCDIMGVSPEEVAGCEGAFRSADASGACDEASVSSSSSSALATPMVLAAMQAQQTAGAANPSFLARIVASEGTAAGGVFSSTVQSTVEEPVAAGKAEPHFSEVVGRFISVPKISNIFKGLRRKRATARGKKAVAADGAAKRRGTKKQKKATRASLGSSVAAAEQPAASAALREVASVLLQSKDYVPAHEQEHAMDMLISMSSELPAACPVALPVQLEYLKPLQMSPSTRPRKASAEVQRIFQSGPDLSKSGAEKAASSAFFYDPFAEQRAREKQSKSDGEVAWSAGSLAQVAAAFSNPLSVPLELQVRACLEGARHMSFSRNVVVPAHARAMEVELDVLPEDAGALTLTGLVIFVNNAAHRIAVDTNGYPVRGKLEISTSYKFLDRKQKLSGAKRASSGVKACVTVVAACPIISLSPCWLDSAHDGRGISEVGARRLVLHDGERRLESLCLHRQAPEEGRARPQSCADLRVSVHETLAGAPALKAYPLLAFSRDAPAEGGGGRPLAAKAVDLQAVRSGGATMAPAADCAAAVCSNGSVFIDVAFSYKAGLQSIMIEVEIIPAVDASGGAIYCRRMCLHVDIELRPSVVLSLGHIYGPAGRSLAGDMAMLSAAGGCDTRLLCHTQPVLQVHNRSSESMLVGPDAALVLSSAKGAGSCCTVGGLATTSVVAAREPAPDLSSYTWAFTDANRKTRSGVVSLAPAQEQLHAAGIAISLAPAAPRAVSAGVPCLLTTEVSSTRQPSPGGDVFEAFVTVFVAKSISCSAGAAAAVSPAEPGIDYLLLGKSRARCSVCCGGAFAASVSVLFLAAGEYRAYAVATQVGAQVAYTHVPLIFTVK